MAAQQKKNAQVEVEAETVKDDSENKEVVDELSERRQQEERQKEWGQQFDKWLINAARRGKAVELLLSLEYPGFSNEDNFITGIPKRIDKDFVQMLVDGREVWLQKHFFVGCALVTEPPAA